MPLFAALLSLPLTADYAPLNLAPEQQKRQTLQALLTILLRCVPAAPALCHGRLALGRSVRLELLDLLVDQGPTARILALLTFRPDFSPALDGAVTSHRRPAPVAPATGRGSDRSDSP